MKSTYLSLLAATIFGISSVFAQEQEVIKKFNHKDQLVSKTIIDKDYVHESLFFYNEQGLNDSSVFNYDYGKDGQFESIEIMAREFNEQGFATFERSVEMYDMGDGKDVYEQVMFFDWDTSSKKILSNIVHNFKNGEQIKYRELAFVYDNNNNMLFKKEILGLTQEDILEEQRTDFLYDDSGNQVYSQFEALNYYDNSVNLDLLIKHTFIYDDVDSLVGHLEYRFKDSQGELYERVKLFKYDHAGNVLLNFEIEGIGVTDEVTFREQECTYDSKNRLLSYNRVVSSATKDYSESILEVEASNATIVKEEGLLLNYVNGKKNQEYRTKGLDNFFTLFIESPDGFERNWEHHLYSKKARNNFKNTDFSFR